MKHFLFVLILLSVAGCSPATNENNTEQATITLPTPIVANGNNPTPIQSTITTPPVNATTVPQPEPTAVSETNQPPSFYDLRFATTPSASPTVIFPARTEQIFALWDFANMPTTQPATMRRVWRYNGDAWLDREEVWDVGQYGTTGTMTAVSIYDFEGGGLLSGNYEVDLYLNGQILLSGSFIVEGEEPTVAAIDSEGRSIVALNDTELTLVDRGGRSFKLVDTDHPISEIIWLPPGNKVVFVTRDATEQIGGSGLGVKHALWLFELGSFDAVPLGFYDEDFHEVGASANGRYLSLIAGTSYGDACMVDRSFYVMQLNDSGQRTNLYELAQFNGVPRGQLGQLSSFYPVNSSDWLDNNQLTLEIAATCLTEEDDQTLPGIYQLDVANLSATRIGDLTSQ